MKEEIPDGWTATTLGEVCSKPQYGWTGSGAKSGQIKYIRTTDISGGKINWTTVPFCNEIPEDIEKYRIRCNDVLVSRAGSVGISIRITEVPCDAIFASYLIRFNALAAIEPKYIEYFLKSDGYWRSISEFTAGIAIPNVNASKLASLDLPLAPFNEQRRILAKLDKLLDKVDACQKRLANIPLILKRFRRSVLAAACSGRLTENWRETKVFDDNSEPRETPDGFPSLPETWQWRRLDSICQSIVDCPHSTPKWTESGRICIRTTNFKAGFLDLSEVRYVSNKTFTERIERLKPLPGDVLYSREGGILGIACMIPPNIDLCLGQRMMLFRTNSDYKSTFLMYWLNSPLIVQRVQALIGGSASPHLNVGDIKTFPTPIPPLEEQKEIIKRVEALFTFSDQIEDRYRKAKTHVDKLTQSILSKAFRGELVPQDPDDEPASVLLERIGREKKGNVRN